MPDALPAGYRARPATSADVAVIADLVAACERDLFGVARTDRGRIAAEFARPRLRPETDTRLVHDRAGRLAARAWVDQRCKIDVHPAHRGLGLGTALLDWAEARAAASGGGQIVQRVPDAVTSVAALLRSRGYAPMVSEWTLEFPMAEEPELPEPPDGITVRPYRPADAHAIHRLIQDAFDAWQPRHHDYPEWARRTVQRPTFAPAASMLALAGTEPVGALIATHLTEAEEGNIEQLAVHPDQRRRGIARLLLRHAFRAFHQQGVRTCTLATHSETGALEMYLHLGLRVRESSTLYRAALG